ncbi:MAG: hypothetical protein HYX55_02690 [Chloroflexi bacterium]|nr:hypothetical protein [Chloroflexota bacterium]
MTVDQSIGPRCNIGPDEIARRRRSAVTGSVLLALLAVGLLALHVPPLGRLLLWPVATGVAVTWLQVVRRFCVAFGALGLQNFGRLGGQVAVDPALRATDRRQALRMLAEGAVIGLAATLLVLALPV